MIKQVKATEFFDLKIDMDKNRLYITCKGFWKEETVDEYIANQTEALKHVKPNFTVVADMRDYKTLAQDLLDKQKASQIDLIKAGMLKAAEIVPASAIAKMQLRQVVTDTNVPSQQFATPTEGEAWLDKLSKQ